MNSSNTKVVNDRGVYQIDTITSYDRQAKKILDELGGITSQIDEAVKKQREKGKPIVGIFPPYGPEELVHAAGIFPVGLWGGQTNLSRSSTYLPAFCCSIAQTATELAAKGVYDVLDGYIISTPCDTLKCTGQNLTRIIPGVRPIYCRYPQNNTLPAARIFLLEELCKVKSALEEIKGIKITEENLAKSIAIYNANRRELLRFTGILARYPGILTAAERHTVIKARYFMEKEEHTKITAELSGILEPAAGSHPGPATKDPTQPNQPKKAQRKRIYLCGISADPPALLNILDQNNMSVVGDELVSESRQFRNPVPEGLDQLSRLADQWMNLTGCSFVLDTAKKRARQIAESAAETEADGVIFLQMMFCDPDEFEYPRIKKALDEAGIPSLHLEVQQNMFSLQQLANRIQAFGELLGG